MTGFVCLTLGVGSWLSLYVVTVALSYPLSVMTGRSSVEGESEGCIGIYSNTCLEGEGAVSLPCMYHTLGNIIFVVENIL